jgi:AcrR family transcriptional regulator
VQVLKDDIREAILRIAKNWFLDKGYDKTSMKEIAREVDVSVGNIYRYYPNKEALFLGVLAPTSQALTLLLSDHEASSEASPGSSGFLGELSGVLSRLLLEHRDGLLLLYYRSEGTPLEEAKEKLIVQLTEHVYEHVRGLPVDERAAKPLAVAFLEGLFSMLFQGFKQLL